MSAPAPSARRWQLWQVETARACPLRCVMCPWTPTRPAAGQGLLSQEVWQALRPYLADVATIDFSGGGEPLLQPRLADWIAEARQAGCTTGLLTSGQLLDEATARRLTGAGLDWIAFSLDAADAETYEAIRPGARFEVLVENIRQLNRLRTGGVPRVMLNFVMMTINIGQVEPVVRLAAALGVDRVHFKHCDVIRGQQGRGWALFRSRPDRLLRRHQRGLARACRLARRLGVETTAYSFTPEELPVCDQDPRTSLFVAYDGWVAPCISLALGGPTCFFERDAVMPTVRYGRLPDQDLMDLWTSSTCRFYRDRFAERLHAYEGVLNRADPTCWPPALEQAVAAARRAMPAAPEGCRVCHYLYGV